MLKPKQFDSTALQHPGYVSGRYYALGIGTFSASSSVNATNANTIIYSLFYVHKRVSIDRICINVNTGVTNALARFAVYNNSNGLPSSLVVDCGEVDCSTSGSKEVVVNVTLNAGWYWFAINSSGALPNLTQASISGFFGQTLYGYSSVLSSGSIAAYRQTFTYGAFPSVALQSSYSQSSNAATLPWIRVA